jgi:hypothetical protein
MDVINTFITKSKHLINDSGIELEIRIGTFNGKLFNSGINLTEFTRIKNLLINPIITNTNDTYFYNFPYRQSKNRDSGISIWTNKIKINHENIPEYNIRVAISNEVTKTFKDIIQEFNIKTPSCFFAVSTVTLLRKKTRYSEYLNSWRIDLTMVENFKYFNNKWNLIDTVYEVELEAINDMQNTIELNEIMSNRLNILNPNYYYKLTKNCKFIGNQPKTLERKDLINLAETNYSLTDKVDGERLFLLCCENTCLIDRKMNTVNLPRINNLDGTLIDGEYLFKTKQFLAFDLLYYKNENIMNKTLEERHLLLDSVLNSIKPSDTLIIKPKTFYYSIEPRIPISFVKYSENIFKESILLWKERINQSINLDGLIYTPINETYNYNTNTFKWKNDITIDVLVMNKQYYASNRGKLILLGNEYKFSNKININNEIGEFSFNTTTGQWNLLRIRTDKKIPNAILTIKSAWLAIKQNITIENISEIDLKNTGMQYNTTGKSIKVRKSESDIKYRCFHNSIKKLIIDYKDDTENNNKFLLDLGTGKGGDMMKWKNTGYKNILAIDSSWEHIYGPNGFLERYNKIKDTELKDLSITFIWGDVSKNIRSGDAGLNPKEKTKLKNYFKQYPRLKFDKITCNFAIHYFLLSDTMWNGFIKNIKLLIIKNGLFIGTYLNANKIIEGEFYKNDKLIYTLKRKNDAEISVKTLQWNHFIDEPLLYPEFLNTELEKIKLKKEIGPESFEEFYSEKDGLSVDEKRISFMHNIFIYKK